MAVTKQLRIGVYIPSSVQLLDLSPVDLFGMLDPEYLRACKMPEPLIKCGKPSTIHYISVPKNGDHVVLTANASLRVSKTINDPEVQPGLLDIVLVPGPDPTMVFEEDALKFLRDHATWKGKNGEATDILSVCSGCILLGQSGILKGKKASGPRAIVPVLQKNFPETQWIDDKRWVKDGNIWMSGGITNGQEMVAAYLRETLPGPVTEAVIAMADVGDKGINYTKSKTSETVWWLWQIFRALTFGNGKSKRF